jgi:UDP-glucose 4-epimerase
MRALVTGNAGFMGSHLADELVRMGHEVYGIDNLSGGSLFNVGDEIDYLVADICDAERVDNWFSPFIRNYNYTNNVVGSANIVNACIKYDVKFLCFTSSMAVYGNQQAPFTEGMDTIPIDPYGVAKAAVEQDIRIAGQQHGLEYVIFRPHNVYGPRQNLGDPYRNVVGIWMRQIKNGEPLTIYGDGTQVREFTCIDDVTPYIARSYRKDYAIGRTFNLGLGSKISIHELTGLVCVAARRNVFKVGINCLPPRHEVKESYPSTGLFRAWFNPVQPTPLDDGLRKMWEWAKDEPIRQSKLPEIEVEAGLYPYWKELL